MDCNLSGSSVHGDSLGKNTGVGCHAFLQGIFPTQGSNPGLLRCRQIHYWLSHWGSPIISICFETTGFIYMNKNFHSISHFLFTTITIMLLGGFRVAAKNQSQANSSTCTTDHPPQPTVFSLDFFSSVQSLSHVRLFATPWIAARQASLSITNSRSSLRLRSIESVMPSSHLILCHPLLLLPPMPPSIRVFSNESTLRMRWPKSWSFRFSIIPSKEIPAFGKNIFRSQYNKGF